MFSLFFLNFVYFNKQKNIHPCNNNINIVFLNNLYDDDVTNENNNINNIFSINNATTSTDLPNRFL